MKLINLASNNSTWRGLDYYKSKKVLNIKKINENEYESNVEGSSNNYKIYMNVQSGCMIDL